MKTQEQLHLHIAMILMKKKKLEKIGILTFYEKHKKDSKVQSETKSHPSIPEKAKTKKAKKNHKKDPCSPIESPNKSKLESAYLVMRKKSMS